MVNCSLAGSSFILASCRCRISNTTFPFVLETTVKIHILLTNWALKTFSLSSCVTLDELSANWKSKPCEELPTLRINDYILLPCTHSFRFLLLNSVSNFLVVVGERYIYFSELFKEFGQLSNQGYSHFSLICHIKRLVFTAFSNSSTIFSPGRAAL